MADYPGQQRLCGTCAYLMVNRDVDYYNTWVKNCDGQGRCAIPCGTFRNAQRMSNTLACSDYKKWPVLK